MADAVLFQIEDGVLAFEAVDKSAPGYSDQWQAPAGADVTNVALADYNANSASWSCQVTSGALTAAPDTTTSDVPATFCAPAKTVPTPAETGYSLDVEFLQDPTVKVGLSRFLYEYDTDEAYFLLGLNGDGAAPQAIGRVRVQAGAFGGAARTTLTATLSLPVSRKPQIEWGVTGDSEAVPPAAGTLATGATAGVPGTWTPSGSTAPANLIALQGSTIAASPSSAWTTGQHIITGDTVHAHWDGDTWETGDAL